MTTTDTAPATERREFTHAEWADEARARFGENGLDWAFVCPGCADIATAREFPGPMRERIGQECIGRHRADLPELPAERGCMHAAYGLIPGPVAVTMSDGRVIRVFRFAPAPSRESQNAPQAPEGTPGPANAENAPHAAVGAARAVPAATVEAPGAYWSVEHGWTDEPRIDCSCFISAPCPHCESLTPCEHCPTEVLVLADELDAHLTDVHPGAESEA